MEQVKENSTIVSKPSFSHINIIQNYGVKEKEEFEQWSLNNVKRQPELM